MRGVGVDFVGDIAIVEIPKGIDKKNAVSKLLKNKHVKVIWQKTSERKGKLRIYKLKHLVGEKRTKTIHTESGVRFYVDVAKVYFSPRLSGERLRIAEQVRVGESVLVMFSGAGPYVFVIAKMQPKIKEIYGVEINKVGTKNSIESLSLNKEMVEKIRFINGDVRKVVPKLRKRFDRIVMPAPKSAEGFLDISLKYIKKGGMIHYYDFSPENEINKIIEKVTNISNKYRKKIKILKKVKCGQHSPGFYRVAIDFKVLN